MARGESMINKFYEGIGCLEHARVKARKILKQKKSGTRLNIGYYNGYANFIKKGSRVFLLKTKMG